MFIAGIELFFGLLAGFVILIASIGAAFLLPHFLWHGMKWTHHYINRIPWWAKLSMWLVPVCIGESLHVDWPSDVSVIVVTIFAVNRVLYELRTEKRLRKFCAISFAIIALLIIGGIAVDAVSR
jgi:hypothetical protein